MKQMVIDRVTKKYDFMILSNEDQYPGLFVFMTNHYIHIPYCTFIGNTPRIRVIEYKYTGLTGWYTYEEFITMMNNLDKITSVDIR